MVYYETFRIVLNAFSIAKETPKRFIIIMNGLRFFQIYNDVDKPSLTLCSKIVKEKSLFIARNEVRKRFNQSSEWTS